MKKTIKSSALKALKLFKAFFKIGNKGGFKSSFALDEDEERPFDTVKLGDEELQLLFKDKPHTTSSNNIYARSAGGSLYDFDGHRMPIKIEIEEYNYLKSSYYSGDEIRKGCKVKVFAHGIQILDEFARNYEYGYKKATKYIDDLELFWDWFPRNVNEKIGKHIYYLSQLCKINSVIVSQGCIIIERVDGKNFDRQPWHDEDFDDDDDKTMKIEITSPNIWWYVKEEE